MVLLKILFQLLILKMVLGGMRVDVDTVLNLYIFFLAAAAVLCMVIAWFVTRIS